MVREIKHLFLTYRCHSNLVRFSALLCTLAQVLRSSLGAQSNSHTIAGCQFCFSNSKRNSGYGGQLQTYSFALYLHYVVEQGGKQEQIFIIWVPTVHCMDIFQ